MSGPMLLLTITAVLIFSGLLQRVLDRMYLTDKQALLIIGLMLIGTFLPELTIGAVSINIGGAIIPLAVCAYLFVRADQPWERWRSVLGSIMAAAAVYAISTLMPENGTVKDSLRAMPAFFTRVRKSAIGSLNTAMVVN